MKPCVKQIDIQLARLRARIRRLRAERRLAVLLDQERLLRTPARGAKP
jgi:hypothetical protein